MTTTNERRKMVLAMEYIARQINDEYVFDGWLMVGVPDGDIPYGSFDENDVDDYYIETENFRALMDAFLRAMSGARCSGGLYCGQVTTEQG